MIIQLIGDGIYSLISSIITFSIPTISNTVLNSFSNFVSYLQNGINIYAFFVPPFANYILTLVIVVKVSVDLYFLIMWILSKIPMLNIH